MKRTGLGVLIGAAAVAGLALAGCSGAAGVDYASTLAGTWNRAAEAAELSLEVAGQTVEAPVRRSITVTVTRTAANKGTVMLTVTNAPDRDNPFYSQLPQTITSLLPDSIEASASGALEAEADQIKVTVSDVMLPENIPLPASQTAAVGALKGMTHRIAYEITGDRIALSGAVLVLLEVTDSPAEKLELTKQESG